tara:strand:+ start:26 stop:520 length:495 start_codon:yes stop_codon:yes gene_type:complete
MTLVATNALRKTERVLEYNREWKRKNRAAMLAQRKIYREANKAKQKIYFKKYRLDNLDKELIRNRNWVLNNRDKKRVKASIRRARLKEVNDIKTSEDRKLLAIMYKTALSYEVRTGFAWHVDHTIPITKGGRHCLTNLQIVPASWNQSKGNRHKRKFVYATKEI